VPTTEEPPELEGPRVLKVAAELILEEDPLQG